MDITTSRATVTPRRSTTRRAFLGSIVAGAAVTALPPSTDATGTPAIKALALDGFTSLDPRPVVALAERMFPGKGAELGTTWRSRQFEYTWLRALTHRYADFWTVTEEALVFAAQASGVELSAESRARLMDAYLHLTAYPDVRPALTTLRSAGIRLAFLTNLSPRMVDAAIDSAGLQGLFELRLSTDALGTYKPDPRAYQLGVDAFGLSLDEIGFVASGGWDAAGARSFGYRTFWVNRGNHPVEELGVRPDAIGADLTGLLGFVRRTT